MFIFYQRNAKVKTLINVNGVNHIHANSSIKGGHPLWMIFVLRWKTGLDLLRPIYVRDYL